MIGGAKAEKPAYLDPQVDEEPSGDLPF
jgi:hypothetical protein